MPRKPSKYKQLERDHLRSVPSVPFLESYHPKELEMHTSLSVKKQQERVEELEAEIERLQSMLGPHRDADAIVKRHIKLLHQYNEVKDATQILIGRLAACKETTIRQVHKDYGLEDAD